MINVFMAALRTQHTMLAETRTEPVTAAMVFGMSAKANHKPIIGPLLS
jgi:hypothetical protein